MRTRRISLTTIFAVGALALAMLGTSIAPASAAEWSAWSPLGGQFTSDPAATLASNGRLVAFGRGLNGHVWSRLQNSDYSWGGWYDRGAPGTGIVGDVDVVKAANGQLVVFARDADNQIQHMWQTADGGWSAWSPLGGQFTSDPAATLASNGRLVAFGRGLNGHVWSRQQNLDYSWGGWYDLGAPGPNIVGGVEVVKAANDRLVVFARADGDQMQHMWQTP
jgi:hypothetical protein